MITKSVLMHSQQGLNLRARAPTCPPCYATA